jgi:phosphoenolpyruvate-protein phosphotransferase/dihydroxyacetone kinase phosphotransfer subunit
VIGVVVVSHSRALAEAALTLAWQMVPPDAPLRVAVAAGAADGSLGTDATAVAAAIEEVDGPEGVLVLLDLGSAVLSAEMAVELLPPEPGRRVRLTPAPLVEGLVAALVLAATGANLDAVAEEAERGLVAKQTHLADQDQQLAVPAGQAAPAGPSIEVMVSNPHGLHARPSARVVALAQQYEAMITVENLYTECGFGDNEPPSRQPGQVPSTRGSGLDLAMGPALVRRGKPDTAAYRPGDIEQEMRRSRAAVAAVSARLTDLEHHTMDEAGAIFAAQRALLADPEIAGAVDADLADGVSAVTAWQQRLDAVARRFEALEDAYQRERAADVRSIQALVLRALTGAPEGAVAGDVPVILVVDELDAATAASLDANRVAGIVVTARGRTGHGAIVAASRGIPLFIGAGREAAEIRDGQRVAFDTRRHKLWTSFSRDDVRRWPAYLAERRRERAAALDAARQPALTRDGTRVPVLAHVGSLADAEAAAAAGADGSGLVRTEVLFADRRDPPSVDEQTRTLLALARALRGAPLTVRTWDVGGDKQLPFLALPREDNPFLGVRGLRAFLGRNAPLPSELLADQLTAVCRAARETPIRVMFPMVTSRAELDAVLSVLREAAGTVPSEGLRVGIMVEVPAAALTVRSLAAGLDFVSIGTNDLTQYALAADRGNDAVADLADPLTPAVLRLVDLVGRERPQGVTVAVCGDLASRPDAVPLLLGLGVNELSCVPAIVPEVKAAVRLVDLGQARALAREALLAPDAASVRALLTAGGSG